MALLDPVIASPSVQVLINPGQRSRVISTHDQILGGHARQVFIGCQFPAHESYRWEITRYALAIAAGLAEQSVRGVCSIDFLVTVGKPSIYFCEINLRLGGTTHPFGISKYITSSRYDEESGLLQTRFGPRYYVASDNAQIERLVGRSASTVLNIMSASGLLFSRFLSAGVTLHQLGSIPTCGKFGLCSVAPSLQQARSAFDSTLLKLAQEEKSVT